MEIAKNVESVIETELRAWAVEAISAIQTGESLSAMDDEKQALIDGWVGIKKGMLNDLPGNDDNAVIARLRRYLKRELDTSNDIVLKYWVERNSGWLIGKIEQFSRVVTSKTT
jgi:hypothetical protein